MLKLSLLILLCPFLSYSNDAEPKFYYADGLKPWGVTVIGPEKSDLTLRLGTRLQTVTSFRQSKNSVTNDDESFSDSYIRRARLQVEAKYKEGIKFYMDIRNDNANLQDSGESDFNIGDAYIEKKDIFDIKNLRLRAFRAKVNVSRTQTVSSSNLIFLDRASIADQAAQFVSHNRRASNIQLLGAWDHIYFQAVVGDGVQKASFNDAKGNSLSSGAIDAQNFMIGGKVRVYPFKGWEDKDLVETYFGHGQHFSFAAGLFNTSSIEYRNSSKTQVDEVSRELINLELSFHYENFSIVSEFFRFNGVIEDFSANAKNVGSSDGYYIQSEYVFKNLSYLAPFVRYEKWDRFKQLSDYDFESYVAGLNWYTKGNKIRFGLVYQYDKSDSNLVSVDSRGRRLIDDQQFKLTSMWHY